MKLTKNQIKNIILDELVNLSEALSPEWREKVKALRKRWDEYQDSIPLKTEKEVPVFGYWSIDKEEKAIKMIADSLEIDDENLEEDEALEKAKQIWSQKTEEEKEEYYEENYIEDRDQFEKDMDVQRQDTSAMDKPPFAKGKARFDPAQDMTDQRTYKMTKAAAELRRVKFGQTKGEIALERELMKLWQEMADIAFFKSDAVTYTHDVGYKSAAKAMYIVGDEDYSKTETWLAAQDTVQKSGISTTAKIGEFPAMSSQTGLSGGFGYFIKGHPVFIAARDLASQTQSMADKDVKDYYKSSGLPKRASLAKFGKEPDPNDISRRFMKKRMKRKGASDEDIDSYFNILEDMAILDANDMVQFGGVAQEAIIANWTIAAWYIDPRGRMKEQAMDFFRKNKDSITKPIYVGEKRYNIEELV